MQQSTPTRNLLIVQTAPEQNASDWIAIKQRIERNAPDIEVRIADNRHRNSVTARWQVRRPSLVFSPVRLIDFVPRGGADHNETVEVSRCRLPAKILWRAEG